MKRALVLMCIVVMAGWAMTQVLDSPVWAADKPAKKQKTHVDKKAKGHKQVKVNLSGPLKNVTGLTEQQKEQIAKIQQEIAQKIKELKEQEKQQILSVLTEEQKQQYNQPVKKQPKDKNQAPRQKKNKPAKDQNGDQ